MNTPERAPSGASRALRIALLALLGPAVLAALFAFILSDERTRAQQGLADERAIALAATLAADIDAIATVLRVAAYTPSMGDAGLAQLGGAVPIAGDLDRLDLQANVINSSNTDAQRRSLVRGDRAWFREARDRGGLVMSDAYRQRGSGRWVVTIAFGGHDTFVTAFTFPTEGLKPRFIAGGADGDVFLVGASGNVIAATRAGWEGRTLTRGSKDTSAATAAARAGEVLSSEGHARTHAGRQVARTGWNVVVAIPAGALMAGRLPVWSLFAILAVLLAAFAIRTLMRVPVAPASVRVVVDDSWRQVAEAAGLCAWEWDLATDTVRYSAQWKAALGYDDLELRASLGEWAARMHPEDVASTMAALHDHVEGRAPRYAAEFRMRHHDGHWVSIRDRGFVVERDVSGRALRAVGWNEDVSEQRKAEVSAADNDRMMRAIYDRGPHAVVVYSFETGRMISANPAALIRLGFAASEFTGRTATELGLWVDATDRIRLYEALVRDGRAGNLEIRLRSKSGEELHWIVFAERVESSSGEMVLTHGVDVTAERRAQAALRESSQLFRIVFEESPYPILVTRVADGRLHMVNTRACRLTGYDASEMIGRTTEELKIWRESGQREALLAQLARDGVVRDVEIAWSDRAGKEYVGLMNGVVFEARGEKFILAITADITERKRSEETLHRLQALLGETGRVARVGGWVYEPDTGSITWTDEALRLHECPPGSQPTAEQILSHYPEESRRIFEHALGEAIKSGTTWDLELEVRGMKGRPFWARAMGRAEQVDGRTVRVYGAFQDITERMQARLAVERLTAELETRVVERTTELRSAVAKLEAFSATVANDLGAPLRAAEASLRLAFETDPPLPDDAKVFLDQARGSLERARAAAQATGAKVPRITGDS